MQRHKNVQRQQSISAVLETREDEISELRKQVKRLKKATSMENLDSETSWSNKFELRTAQAKLGRLEKEVLDKNAEIENLKRSNTKLQLKVVRLHKNAKLSFHERCSLKSIDGNLDVSVGCRSSSSCESGSSELNITIDRQKGLIQDMLQLLIEDEKINASDVGEVENVIQRLKTEKLRRSTLGEASPRSPSCGPVDMFQDLSLTSSVEVIDGVECYE